MGVTMGTFLWARFLHGPIVDTQELNLTRLTEEHFFFAHLSGGEDFFLLTEGKLD